MSLHTVNLAVDAESSASNWIPLIQMSLRFQFPDLRWVWMPTLNSPYVMV